jgi:hypothetical protein
MKSTLLILSVFVAFTNACNQNTTNKTTEIANVEKTIELNNSDTISNEIEPKEIVAETKPEQIKVEKTTINKSETKKKHFTLLSATSQSWTAGIPSGGTGTDYYFKIKINSADKIKFDSAWINNKRFEIFISRETAAISNEQINFSKGDNITLRVSEIKNQNIKTENLKPPLEYEGAALIGYTVNDKRQYFIIKEIKKQSTPNRP